MSKLHLVFGGRVKDPRALDFDLGTIDLVGIYDSYAAAEDAWRGAAQRTVDDAEMKYFIFIWNNLNCGCFHRGSGFLRDLFPLKISAIIRLNFFS